MRHIHAAQAIAVGLLLSGCQSEAPDANQTAPSDAQASAPVAAQAGSSGLWNNGQPKPLQTQVAHPNGVVLQLTSLKSEAASTLVGVQVINGRDRDIDLNRWNTRQGYLLLDSGERLYLSPPATNTKLTVPAGQTFEGELVFLGRLPPVRAATLVLNENATADSEHTTTPGFRIDLPVAEGAGAAQ